jgi:GNAT superfamily N-acetyltransferase
MEFARPQIRSIDEVPPVSAFSLATLVAAHHRSCAPIATARMRKAVTRLRPAVLGDEAAILAVQAASWRATYTGLVPERVFPRADDPARLRFWRETLLTGRTATRVAVAADGAVTGFVSCGPRRDPNLPAEGEIYALYLLPEAQGAGLGRRLLHAAAHILRARGARRLGLWVLAANAPARAFYAHLGGAARLRQQSVEDGVTFDEIAYVWDPIDRACG